MSERPYVLAETTWTTVRETTYEVAVLPWGATEAHNLHLPYGTDNIETERIACEAARIAWTAGAKVIVLPTLPFGVNTQQLAIKLTLNMNPSTQARVLADLAEGLAGQGLRKLLILNGHGGNDFRQMIRELQVKLDLFLCTLNWYTLLAAEDYFDEPGDHAGEMETSLMMHLAPELVRPLSEAGSGSERHFKLEGLRERWVWAPRDWIRASRDTGIGNPAASSAEKGQGYFAATTRKIADFLIELAATDSTRLYEDGG